MRAVWALAALAAVAPVVAVPNAAAQSVSGTPLVGGWQRLVTPAYSEAVFGARAVVVRCELATRRLSIIANPALAGSLTLVTDDGRDGLGAGTGLPAGLTAFDRLAFARGRFALVGSGGAGRVGEGETRVVPWGAEIARSIEDCRI